MVWARSSLHHLMDVISAHDAREVDKRCLGAYLQSCPLGVLLLAPLQTYSEMSVMPSRCGIEWSINIGPAAKDGAAGPRAGLRPLRRLRADQPHPLGPGSLIFRRLQLLLGEDDSPARSVVVTNRVAAWPSGVD
jgi:hypothetical protein